MAVSSWVGWSSMSLNAPNRRKRSNLATDSYRRTRQSRFNFTRSGLRLPYGRAAIPGAAGVRQTAKRAGMSERLETLKKARDRMVEDRDAHAKVLAAPFDRDKAERARAKFVEIQALIDAIDRAIAGEQAAP
jgi:hypothetical protein